MRRPTVLIFLSTDFSRSDGGALWTTNMLECMARVSDVDFIIVSSGPSSTRDNNQEFTRSFGFDHIFVPLRQGAVRGGHSRWPRTAAVVDRVLSILMDKYYFQFERDSQRQRHIDAAVKGIYREKRPDLLIVNGRYAALHVPSLFSFEAPCCLIILNNEVAYHSMYKSQDGPIGSSVNERFERWLCRHGNWLSNRRFSQHMQSIFNRCAGIVALTKNDLPMELPEKVVRAVIPPVLKRSEQQWAYQASRSVLFVGNFHVLKFVHFANRLAIEWICTRLAPEVLRIDRTIRLRIIGASWDQVPTNWRSSNVQFLGRADREEVNRQMTTADLFIAPIANNFGAKLKLSECASRGMPFLATDGAMSGMPFLTSIPTIDLEQPRAAAHLIVECINQPKALLNLSESIAVDIQRARIEQDVAWSTFLRRALGTARYTDK